VPGMRIVTRALRARWVGLVRGVIHGVRPDNTALEYPPCSPASAT